MNRIRLGASALAGALCLLAAPAFAQSARHSDYESPQHFALELRAGLYYPNIDNEFSGPEAQRPFHTAFGDNSRLTIGGELDWQAFRIPYVGTIGPGVGVQYLKFGRPALIAGTTKPAQEDTSLSIFPMAALAVLRVDVLAREIGIPIVPYVKGGLGVGVWHLTNGSGTSKITETAADGTTSTKATGRGISYGPQFALGAMLQLDWLDAYAAQQADEGLGINNTYLFAEFVSSHLNNVHNTGLQIGANQFAFGLAFEF